MNEALQTFIENLVAMLVDEGYSTNGVHPEGVALRTATVWKDEEKYFICVTHILEWGNNEQAVEANEESTRGRTPKPHPPRISTKRPSDEAGE